MILKTEAQMNTSAMDYPTPTLPYPKKRKWWGERGPFITIIWFLIIEKPLLFQSSMSSTKWASGLSFSQFSLVTATGKKQVSSPPGPLLPAPGILLPVLPWLLITSPSGKQIFYSFLVCLSKRYLFGANMIISVTDVKTFIVAKVFAYSSCF